MEKKGLFVVVWTDWIIAGSVRWFRCFYDVVDNPLPPFQSLKNAATPRHPPGYCSSFHPCCGGVQLRCLPSGHSAALVPFPVCHPGCAVGGNGGDSGHDVINIATLSSEQQHNKSKIARQAVTNDVVTRIVTIPPCLNHQHHRHTNNKPGTAPWGAAW